MAKISILTPVYNEEDTVLRCYEEVKRIFKEMDGRHTYEHLFGDNRSTDARWPSSGTSRPGIPT